VATTLEIGIPTYQRAPKLRRVLGLFRRQIVDQGLADRVSLRVHDNASTDATQEVCEEARREPDGVRVDVLRQTENVGFNRNVWSLYQRCQADYLWTFADVDLPLPGAVATILRALEAKGPELLVFSFIQPPGSTKRTFDLPTDLHVETDPGACARFAWRQPKLSQYVYRRRELSPEALGLVTDQLDRSAFAFIALAFSLLQDAATPSVAVLSPPQATCDEDYLKLRFVPDEWGRYDELLQHPFLRAHAPELAEGAPRDAYRSLLSVLWSWRCGGVQVPPDDEAAWWDSVRRLPARWPWLREHPGDLLRFAVLKVAPRLLPQGLNRASGALRRLRGRAKGA
jgi:hypothetical protein